VPASVYDWLLRVPNKGVYVARSITGRYAYEDGTHPPAAQDAADLEALGETAARLNRWEFMLTIAPVPVTGGTGFPLNAIAMF
jgi:hypothetical protein